VSAPERKSSSESELVSQGWTKRFCASGSRVQEAVELYESIGLEVHLEPVRVEDLGCAECLQGPFGSLGDCYVIYTRPRKQGADKELPGARKPEDELW
jgi:hypothetical protein